MEDYPRNLSEFEARFDTEQACRDYLFRLRWPEGFRCPRGTRGHFWPVRSGLMQCQSCGHQTSVTAGALVLRCARDAQGLAFWKHPRGEPRRGAEAASRRTAGADQPLPSTDPGYALTRRLTAQIAIAPKPASAKVPGSGTPLRPPPIG